MADNILRIGAEFDVSPIIEGAQAATDSFDKIEAHVQAANAGLRATGSAAQASAFQYEPLLNSVARLAQEIQYTRPAIADETAESQKLLGTIASLSSGLNQETEEENQNEEAHNRNSESISREAIQTRLATDVLTGQIARSEQALVRFASHIPGVGALMEGLFPIFAAGVFVDLLTTMGEKVYHVFENVVLLKGAIDAWQKANEQMARTAAEFNYSYEQSVARRFAAEGRGGEAARQTEKAESDKPLELPTIPEKLLNQFNKDFVSFTQAVHATKDSKSILSRIAEEAASAQIQLDEAKKKFDALNAAAEVEKASGRPVSGATTLAIENQRSKVENLTEKQNYLQSATGQVESQSGTAAEAAAVRAAEATKRAAEETLHYETEIAAKKEAAEKSEFLGQRNEKVESLRVELSLLEEKQKLEQQEITLKVRSAGGGDKEQSEASQFVVQKYQLERLTLTRQLTQAEQEYKQSLASENESAAAAFAETQSRMDSVKDRAEKLRLEESAMISEASKRDLDFSIRAAETAVAQQVKYHETIVKLAEESSLRSIGFEETAAVTAIQIDEQKRLVFATTATERARIEQQAGNEEVEVKRRSEDEKLRIEMKSIEAQKAAQLGIHSEQEETTFVVNADPEQLAKLAGMNAQIEALQAAHVARMKSFDDQIAENSIRMLDAQAQGWHRFEDVLTSGMQRTTQGVLTGTVRISEGFRRMGVDMVTSIIDSFEKILIKQAVAEIQMLVMHAVSTQTQVAQTAAGAAEQQSILQAAHVKEIMQHAKAAAAGAFHWVMAEIPFPLDLVLAPAAAAAAFAGVLAFAEKGAMVPEDMPVFAHAGEMILPEPISSGIQAAIPAMHQFADFMPSIGPFGEFGRSSAPQPAIAGAGADRSVNLGGVHINALDSKSVSDFLNSPGTKTKFTKMLQQTVRNGTRFR